MLEGAVHKENTEALVNVISSADSPGNILNSDSPGNILLRLEQLFEMNSQMLAKVLEVAKAAAEKPSAIQETHHDRQVYNRLTQQSIQPSSDSHKVSQLSNTVASMNSQLQMVATSLSSTRPGVVVSSGVTTTSTSNTSSGRIIIIDEQIEESYPAQRPSLFCQHFVL